MGVRNDKGRRISRLITGHTGIVTQFDLTEGIIAPRPYSFTLCTDRHFGRHAQAVRDLSTYGIAGVIRFDNTFESVHDAWFTMRIDTALELIKLHHDQGRK